MDSYLFSYGTLLPQYAPPAISNAVAKLQPIGKGFVSGTLYDFGEYPGAVLDNSPGTRISGTIFRLPDDSHLIEELDEYEGYNPNSPRKSLFVRKLHPITLSTGRTLRCWIYVYNQKPGSAPKVSSGRYRKAATRRSTK
jgi:gamma-glutamylcyclotransferase (GGCT)/AIG2-like uncharacterized protein YtfP